MSPSLPGTFPLCGSWRSLEVVSRPSALHHLLHASHILLPTFSALDVSGLLQGPRPLLLYTPMLTWLTILVIDALFKPYLKQPRPMNMYARPGEQG